MPKRDAILWLNGSSGWAIAKSSGIGSTVSAGHVDHDHGKEGAAGWQNGEYCECPAFSAVEVDRLGGGDAFSAGFIHGWLKTNHLESGLRYGNAPLPSSIR